MENIESQESQDNVKKFTIKIKIIGRICQLYL